MLGLMFHVIHKVATNVEVEGIGMNVQKAKTAIRDLMDKGYCSYTTGEDFYEDSIMVHPMYFTISSVKMDLLFVEFKMTLVLD